MSKVEQALKSAIEVLSAQLDPNVPYNEYCDPPLELAIEKCKAALAELEKCEPVARFVSKRLTPEGTQEFFGFLLVDSISPLSLLYTSPQIQQPLKRLSVETVNKLARNFESTNDFADAIMNAMQEMNK